VLRPLPVFGYDDAPHGHMPRSCFDNVRVPVSNILLGEGPRLRDRAGPAGPGPHPPLHALIGLAERALELMCRAVEARGLRQAAVGAGRLARAHRQARCMIDQARLLTLKAAWMMDTVGNKAPRPRSR
jgi:acyl-CoA dehydrogenase